MSQSRKPTLQEEWDLLPHCQKVALCCYTGTPLPLYTNLNFTAASIKALRRKGLWLPPEEGGGPSPRARRMVKKCAPQCPPIKEQLKMLAQTVTP